MDKLTKNLRLMDSRIKDRRARNEYEAAIEVASRDEANELMEALIERGVYDMVESSWKWELDTGYRCVVFVGWE